MRVATNTPARKASAPLHGADASTSSGLMRVKRDRPLNPVEREQKRLKAEYRSPTRGVVNAVKTVLAVLVWTVLGGVQVVVVAPYVSYPYAQGALFGMAVSSAVLLHLWPPRTPQWRTLFWAFWITGLVGSTLLLMGAGRMALTGATVAGYGVVLLRMNENGRKLVSLFKDWRALR